MRRVVFADDGHFPNSALPLVLHRAALPADATAMERRFAAQGWSGAWRNGIFAYHHFHSTAHEVLGIARGRVTVRFGGPHGESVRLVAGDVAVIPAGVAHRNLGDADLLVVGAYPGGADWDLRRGDAAEIEQVRRNVAAVTLPMRDPVTGGPIWREPDPQPSGPV